MTYREIQIWGDSIMKGVIYDETRSRYALLKENVVRLVSEKSPIPLSNHSQMGRTAPQGLAALKASEDSLESALVILEFGGNDCDFNWREVAQAPRQVHLCNTPSESFIQALQAMVDLVRKRGGTPVLCTLPPLDAPRYFNWITRDGLSRENILQYIGVPERIYRWQEYYSSLVLRAASRLNCACLPLREAFLEMVRAEEVLCLDGIHPNGAGHQLMASVALNALSALA